MSVNLSEDLRKTLGIVRNVPKIDWYQYSGIIATPPKFGKTTLASIIPDSILIACEKGYDSLDMDVRRIKSWDEFVELIDVVEEHIDEIGESIRIAAIDTVHELWDFCNTYMLNRINNKLRQKGKPGVETLAQYDYRNGLVMRDREFKTQITRLKDLGIQLIWMSHLVKKKIKPEDEESFYSLDLDFDENLYGILVKDASYVLIGQNIKEKDTDGNLVVKRKFVSKNDGILQGGSRVHFGEDIYFDTEQEFFDKFTKLYRETVVAKNNIKTTEVDKMIKKENEELLEQRKEIKDNQNQKKELIMKIKTNMTNKELSADKKKQVLNFLLETYGDKSVEILKDRTKEELEAILNKF